MKSRQLLFIIRWILPVTVFLILLGVTVIKWADISHGELPVLGELPDFEFTAQDGQPFGKTDLAGKFVVASFFFSSCPNICPLTNSRLSQVYEKFKGSGQVQIISISVDPKNDSLPVLQEYARRWQVDDGGWKFLRAPADSVAWLCEKGFMLPAYDLPAGHTTRFTVLDRQTRIRAYFDGLDDNSADQVIETISRLARED